jgi:DNA-binding IclR family transcriptional regulator
VNPVHCTALGKVLMAFLPEAEIHAILDQQPLIRKTPKTITRKAHLLQHLAEVREQGVAYDLEENTSGITCIAAPIFGRSGQVFAGLSIAGPTARITPKLTAIKGDIQEAVSEIARKLDPLSKPDAPVVSRRVSR